MTSVHISGNFKAQPESMKVPTEIVFLIAPYMKYSNIVFQRRILWYRDWLLQRNNIVLFSFSAPLFSHRYLGEIRTLRLEKKKKKINLNSLDQSFCFILASVHLTEQVKDVKSKQEIQYYLHIPLLFSSQQKLSVLAGDDGKIYCCPHFSSLLLVSALSAVH